MKRAIISITIITLVIYMFNISTKENIEKLRLIATISMISYLINMWQSK